MIAAKSSTHLRLIGALFLVLAGFGEGAMANDLSTPTPTPTPYINPIARRGELRKLERTNRRRAALDQSQSNAQARAQSKASRRSQVAAQAQTREAARAREQAQRQVAAEARSESARATPHPSSDLMRRMGFSEQDIAAQKAREDAEKSGSKNP